MSIKILLDTDIGSDIDDAICLAYLLANPECELMGITTVTGEAEKRAQMASALCKAAGRQIPIFPGAETPILIDQMQRIATQASALAKWEHESNFPERQAIHFLIETIHSYPGEIILLAIGPMTNIALLFAMDPEVPSLLKGLVLMCGVFTNRLAGIGPLEWNARGDPHATAVVYRHAIKMHRSIGLDVTCQVRMRAEEVKLKFQSALLKPVLDFAEIWFQRADQVTFHDPLAAATIFDERICQFEKGVVEVELASEKLAGMTHWIPEAPDPRHEVAFQVDRDRFINHFFSVFDN